MTDNKITYEDARKLRQAGFSNILSAKLLTGQEGISPSIRKSLSVSTAASLIGLKEKFDPLNIAKTLTGGSSLAPALLGRMFGRSQEDIDYFTGSKGKSYSRTAEKTSATQKKNSPFYLYSVNRGVQPIRVNDSLAVCLNKLYNLIKRHNDKVILWDELKHDFEKEKKFEEENQKKKLAVKIKKEKQKLKEKQREKKAGKEPKTLMDKLKGLVKSGVGGAARTTSKVIEGAKSLFSAKATRRVLAAGAGIVGAVGLGNAVAKYESGKGGSNAVGYDEKGGTSYGKYQISSKAGTFNEFLDFLEQKDPQAANELRSAGNPNTGSNKGKPVDVWKKLVSEGRIQQAEHDFIKEMKFDKAIRIAKQLGYNVDDPRIQEMVWSGSIQHGRIDKILQGAAGESDTENQIKKFYEVRTEYAKKNVASKDLPGVLKRYKDEEQTVLNYAPASSQNQVSPNTTASSVPRDTQQNTSVPPRNTASVATKPTTPNTVTSSPSPKPTGEKISKVSSENTGIRRERTSPKNRTVQHNVTNNNIIINAENQSSATPPPPKDSPVWLTHV